MNSPQASPTSTVYDDELTEEERVEYEKGVLTWSKCKDWRFWIRKEWIWYYVLFIVLVVLVALMAFFHHSVSIIPLEMRVITIGVDAEGRLSTG